ncbi:MAG TPA: hypothetical protein VKR30_10175 [Candidatus Limnocylindrales bacterium]|nr:hypothetical protein [Candidatus Limnocylindrales bacterium]
MTAQDFGGLLLPWHDFFLATAGATAALLGLLFVGVSINLSAITADERIDLKARAAQAFTNLVMVLMVSLEMLIPSPDPNWIAAGLVMASAFGIVRVVQNLSSVRSMRQSRSQTLPLRATLRRVGWTAIADLVLLFTAWRIWDTQGQANVIANLIFVTFVLLVGAADIAWEMLTEVSGEAA